MDADFRAKLSDEQLARLERLEQQQLAHAPVAQLAPQAELRYVGADRARLEQRRVSSSQARR